MSRSEVIARLKVLFLRKHASLSAADVDRATTIMSSKLWANTSMRCLETATRYLRIVTKYAGLQGLTLWLVPVG